MPGLHSHNILLKSPRLQASSAEELYKVIGSPQKLPAQRLDQEPVGPEAPRYCIPPASIVVAAKEVIDAEVIIADFGEAFPSDSRCRNDMTLRTPTLLLPPESIFGEGLTQAVDVWTAACTLYQILGERPLFEGFMPDEDHAITEMISTPGPLPARWYQKWTARHDYFLEDGSWNEATERPHAPYFRPLHDRLRIMGRGKGAAGDAFTTHELAALESLLRSMLAYEPAERITSAKAQKEPWVLEYGLPSIQERLKPTSGRCVVDGQSTIQ